MKTKLLLLLIFEDKDGDGRFDTRKVFTDELQMLTSIEVGRGGVWVMRSEVGDVAILSVGELVKLHLHPNEWFTRQARLELASRAEAGRGIGAAKEPLRQCAHWASHALCSCLEKRKRTCVDAASWYKLV